jgi:hypothetical protein
MAAGTRNNPAGLKMVCFRGAADREEGKIAKDVIEDDGTGIEN